MKKLKFIVLFLFTSLFINGNIFYLYALGYPGEVDVWYISFNYDQGSYNHDALSIKQNATSNIYSIEWSRFPYVPPSNKEFAYIKNQSNRRVRAVFYHNQNKYQTFQMIIISNPHSGVGFGNYGNNMVEFPPNGDGYSELATFEYSGSVPSSVGKRNVTLKWWVELIVGMYPSSFNIGYTNHDYYTLLAAPQAPMTVPWTDVLDSACVWASGQTSNINVATKITNELYSSGFDYESSSGAPRYGGWTQFKLTQFISELGSSYDVNCLDMGKAVTTFSNAVGCALNLTTYGHSSTFPLNCIDPIGSSGPTNNTFRTTAIGNDCRSGGFGYHAFAEQTSNNNVWDATLRYDIDSNQDNVTGSNPNCGSTVSGYSWKQPCNESESTYIERLVDDWTLNHFYSPQWYRNRSFSVN